MHGLSFIYNDVLAAPDSWTQSIELVPVPYWRDILPEDGDIVQIRNAVLNKYEKDYG
jgi:hypothetical protein